MFKINEIKLKNGFSFKPGKLTVIVGPNNSGKTRLLREMESFLTSNHLDLKIIEKISIERSDWHSLKSSLHLKETNHPNGSVQLETPPSYFQSNNSQFDKPTLDKIDSDLASLTPDQVTNFFGWFGVATVAYIRTEDRLVAAKQTTNITQPNNLLVSFYRQGTLLENEISNYTNDVFKQNIKLDFSTPGTYSIRVAKDFSSLPVDPRDALPHMEKLNLLENEGDGIRSFVTSLLMLRLTKRPYLLIDEPEAFLHPPHASELGRIIGKISFEQSILLSTHSVDLLRGILSSVDEFNIIRITRDDRGNYTQILETTDIKKIANDPLLNSTKVLDGLFYQGIVVCEGDSDRTFYERVSRRLFPNDEIFYTHAHNKQTVHKLIEPYSKSGVRNVAIIDIDILRNGADLKRIIDATTASKNSARILALQKDIQEEVEKLSSVKRFMILLVKSIRRFQKELPLKQYCSMPHHEIEAKRSLLKMDISKLIDDGSPWAEVKRKGINTLSTDSQKKFTELDMLCREGGIFIVHCGSLETWLEDQGFPSSSKKSKWIVSALEWLDKNTLTSTSKLQKFTADIRDYLIT